LLAESSTSGVDEQKNAFEQFVYADLLKTEEGWRAVIDYFPRPSDSYFANQARYELAMIHLQRKGEEDEALEYFNYLANLEGKTDVAFRIIGLAGQAVVLTLKKQPEEAAKKLAQVLPQSQLLDRRMSELILRLQPQNDQDARWDELRKRLEAVDSAQNVD
jgi:hypothetical protein